jgi:hypothetical protein
MPRWFNVAGPCNEADHYMLPAMRRLPRIARLIERKSYFVLHAPRQVGKTTALLALGHELTAAGQHLAVLLSVEVGAAFPDDTDAAELAILDAWRDATRARLPADLQPPPWPEASPGRRIGAALNAWARAAPRPLVLFLDEIDALQGQPLISILRQLRDGYPNRPGDFPSSLALVGLRDVRDYRADPAASSSQSASPFNIKDASLTLRNFTADEVRELYAQHTADTGQVFTPAASARAFELSGGHPWLVNALAKEVVEELIEDPATPITDADIDAAKEILIRRQDTHLDSLAERLREPRVRRIIEPILAGEALPAVPEDDLRYVQDLGLVRAESGAGLVIANPIYREVIPARSPAPPSPRSRASSRPGSPPTATSTRRACSTPSWRSGGSTASPSWPPPRTTRSPRTSCSWPSSTASPTAAAPSSASTRSAPAAWTCSSATTAAPSPSSSRCGATRSPTRSPRASSSSTATSPASTWTAAGS